MATGDQGIDLNTLNASFARFERLHPTKAQFTRQGTTSKWFPMRGEAIRGKDFFFRALVTPLSGTRRFGSDGATADFPVAQKYLYQEMKVSFSDLRYFEHTIQYNEIEETRSSNPKYAVAALVKRLRAEVEDDIADQLNSAINQSSTNEKATVEQIYNVDGSAFTGSAASAPAFIKTKGGAISQFVPGEVLDITDVGDGTTLNVTVVVKDVIKGRNGPWSGADRVAAIGPGIICQPSDAFGAASGTAWNATADPAVGDHISRSGEFSITGAKGFHGMPDWFDTSVDVYTDGDGNLLNRESAGNHWMNPEIVIPTGGTASNFITFDMDEHFGEIEDTLPHRVKFGRSKRSNLGTGMSLTGSENAIIVKGALVAIASPALVNDVVRDAKDSQRFTSTLAGTLDAAKRKELFGQVGFEGMVFHSATLPPIAFQGDEGAQPNTVRIIDPQSFSWITHGGGPNKVRWLDMTGHGGAFNRKRGTTLQTPTFYLQGGAYSMAYLLNDQPGANVEIRYVKSSRQ